MSCKTCGNKDRYKQSEIHKSMIEETSPKDIIQGSPPSLKELLKSKAIKEEEELRLFKESIGGMGDDLKIFYVINLIKVINGEEFSPNGQSPDYCLELLHKLLGSSEFNVVNNIYPELKGIISSKHSLLISNRIDVSKLTQ
jgi:hypothetical protein